MYFLKEKINEKFLQAIVTLKNGKDITVSKLVQLYNDAEFEKLHPRADDGKFSKTRGTGDTETEPTEKAKTTEEKPKSTTDVTKIQITKEDVTKTIPTYAEKAKTVTKDNYFDFTIAKFKSAEVPNREPDYTSKSGSEYWYEDGGVYRRADHWGGGIASCDWYLDGNTDSSFEEKKIQTGFAKFEDFLDKEAMGGLRNNFVRDMIAAGKLKPASYEKNGFDLFQMAEDKQGILRKEEIDNKLKTKEDKDFYVNMMVRSCRGIPKNIMDRLIRYPQNDCLKHISPHRINKEVLSEICSTNDKLEHYLSVFQYRSLPGESFEEKFPKEIIDKVKKSKRIQKFLKGKRSSNWREFNS